MKKNIPPILLFIFSLLSTVFIISCEDNEKIANSDQDQDTIAVVDTVRFGDLTTLLKIDVITVIVNQNIAFTLLTWILTRIQC